MKWVNGSNRIPIKSWCEEVEPGAMQQAINLANHPVTFKHIALMPDCHQGHSMPIGGVIACKDHEDTLDQVEEPHNDVETLESFEFSIPGNRCI